MKKQTNSIWRALGVAALGAGLLATAPAQAQEQKLDKVRLAKTVSTAFYFASIDVGIEAGIWKAVGLDLEVVNLTGEARFQQAMAAKSIDGGFASGPGMAFAVKGSPAHAVAAIANQPQNLGLIVLKNSKVQSLAQMKGASVGITSTGSLTDWLARLLAEKQGWGPEGVRTVALGALTSRYAAMRTGELDSTISTIEEGAQLELKGEGKLLTTFGDIVPHFHTHVISMRDDIIKDHPEVVRKVVEAWKRIAVYMRDHPDETVKIVAKAINLPEEVVRKALPDEMAMMNYDGSFSKQALQVVAESTQAVGLLDKVPPISALYAPGFVEVKP
jgi:ABC-type nitrate/sulfonate/bicarbonate transport system substrate-binding protein